MGILKCEICGGQIIAKENGGFECETCGIKYDKSRIQEMASGNSNAASNPQNTSEENHITACAPQLSEEERIAQEREQINLRIENAILSVMKKGTFYTAMEIASIVSRDLNEEIFHMRVSSRLMNLEKSGIVFRKTEGRKTLWALGDTQSLLTFIANAAINGNQPVAQSVSSNYNSSTATETQQSHSAIPTVDTSNIGLDICPKCYLGRLAPVGERVGGFSAGKAALGAVVAGPVGLAAGALGKKKTTYCCTKCGYTVEK